jgi:hypothetical protein
MKCDVILKTIRSKKNIPDDVKKLACDVVKKAARNKHIGWFNNTDKFSDVFSWSAISNTYPEIHRYIWVSISADVWNEKDRKMFDEANNA